MTHTPRTLHKRTHTQTHSPSRLRPFPLFHCADCCIRTWLPFVVHTHTHICMHGCKQAHTHTHTHRGRVGAAETTIQRGSKVIHLANQGAVCVGWLWRRALPPFVPVRAGPLNKRLHFQSRPCHCRQPRCASSAAVRPIPAHFQ